MSEVIRAAQAPKPVGAYPHARRVGNLLFLSGIGPRDAATNGFLLFGHEHRSATALTDLLEQFVAADASAGAFEGTK